MVPRRLLVRPHCQRNRNGAHRACFVNFMLSTQATQELQSGDIILSLQHSRCAGISKHQTLPLTSTMCQGLCHLWQSARQPGQPPSRLPIPLHHPWIEWLAAPAEASNCFCDYIKLSQPSSEGHLLDCSCRDGGSCSDRAGGHVMLLLC